jgi:von Willebrand factor type A domain
VRDAHRPRRGAKQKQNKNKGAEGAHDTPPKLPIYARQIKSEETLGKEQRVWVKGDPRLLSWFKQKNCFFCFNFLFATLSSAFHSIFAPCVRAFAAFVPPRWRVMALVSAFLPVFSLAIAASTGVSAQLSLSGIEKRVKEAALFLEEKFETDVNVEEGGCASPLTGCEFGTSQPGGACNPNYGRDSGCSCSARYVSRDTGVTMYAPGVAGDDKDFADCNMFGFERDFQKLAGADLVAMYMGFQSGVHKSWPGQNWKMSPDSAGCQQPSQCPSFDPRFRNWYVAAATGPKNVVLVLDTSGSMERKNRLKNLKDAANAVIKTLSFADFVGVVSYNSGATVALDATSLQRADAAFRDRLVTSIDALLAGGDTNMEMGFHKAFNLLEESLKNGKTSNCHNAVLFLSDGDATKGKTGNGLVDYVKQLNLPDLDARIFTYAFGDDISRGADVLKTIACQNKGIFAKVPDSSSGENELRSIMGAYYEYFSTAVDRAEDARAVWAEPFLDCCGMGNITVVSHPIYHEEKGQNGAGVDTVRKLLGVVGASVPLSTVSGATLDELLGRSKTCYSVDLTETELEVLRGEWRCGLWWWEWLLIAIFAIGLPLTCCLMCCYAATFDEATDGNFGALGVFGCLCLCIPVLGWGVAVCLCLFATHQAHLERMNRASSSSELSDIVMGSSSSSELSSDTATESSSSSESESYVPPTAYPRQNS